MRILHNEKGIALITSLMFTVMSLVITMTLLYMVLVGTRTSGAMKRYKTSTEAAYGGADIVLKDILSRSLNKALDPTITTAAAFNADMTTYLVAMEALTINTNDCLRFKVKSPNSQWPALCANNLLDASISPDIKFNLRSATGTPFVVYSKIVDTMEYKIPKFSDTGVTYVSMAGNSNTGSTNLVGEAVTESGEGGSGDTNPHRPYRYRIEVQAQRADKSMEKSKLSIQYVY